MKKLATPLRSHSTRRINYIYKEYREMFNHGGFDLISVGPASKETLIFLADHCDGLLLSGGFDVDSSYYHQPLNEKTVIELPEIEAIEFELVSLFKARHKPIFGICRGIQVINVAFGGTLIQDILETNTYQNHLQKESEGYLHEVKVIEDTLLSNYLPNKLMTNSFHHQALDKLAPGFKINAISEDGIIEGIEGDNIIAVQWHPERNQDAGQKGLLSLFNDYFER